jgi:polar amino acid transport system substrate-binding protein
VDAVQLCEQATFDCTQLERVLTLDELTIPLHMAYSSGTPDEVVERTRVAFEKMRAEGVVKRVMDRKP